MCRHSEMTMKGGEVLLRRRSLIRPKVFGTQRDDFSRRTSARRRGTMKKQILTAILFWGSAALLFLGGCSGGGGSSSPGTQSGCNPAAGTGSISINISIPFGTGLVTVEGPAGLSQNFGSTTTLTGLITGRYTFAVQPRGFNDLIVDLLYVGTSSVSEVCLEDGALESVNVVYVLHPASHKLWVIGSQNENIASFKAEDLTAGGTITPTDDIRSSIQASGGIAFDGSGRLWAVDVARPALIAYTADDLVKATPTPSVIITSSSLSLPWSLAFDSSGNLWVGDRNSGKIVKFTPSQLAHSGAQTPSVVISIGTASSSPRALAFDYAGNLWVGVHRTNGGDDFVTKYTPSSLAVSGTPSPALMLYCQTPGPVIGTLNVPSALAFDGSGNLYITYWADNVLARLTPANLGLSGIVIGLTPSVQVTLNVNSLPEGMAFDESGSLWISYGQSVSGEQTIVKFTSSQIAVSGTPTPTTVVSSTAAKYPMGMAFYPVPGTLPLGP
jgi:sugar lactone lactonase YvrE